MKFYLRIFVGLMISLCLRNAQAQDRPLKFYLAGFYPEQGLNSVKLWNTPVNSLLNPLHQFGAQGVGYLGIPLDATITTDPASVTHGVQNSLQEFTSSLENEDTALFLFSTCGLSGSNGEILLPMYNYTEGTGRKATLDADWLCKRLNEAKAKYKVVILDFCTPNGMSNAWEDALVQKVSALPNVTVLVSAGKGEKSLKTEQGVTLFAHALLSTLNEAADRNNDRAISLQEWFQVVVGQVKKASNGKQVPLLLNPKSLNTTPVLFFPAQSTEDALDLLAQSLGDEFQSLNVEGKVMIPPFMTGNNYGENSIERSFGTLPNNFAVILGKKLNKILRDKGVSASVVNLGATLKILQAQNITTDDIGTEKTTNIKVGTTPVKYIVKGRLVMVGNKGMAIEVCLIDTTEMTELNDWTQVALLSISELGEMGTPVNIGEEEASVASDQKSESLNDPVLVEGVGSVESTKNEVLDQIVCTPQRKHPMLDKSLPFQVVIQVRNENGTWSNREGKFVGNDYYVPVEYGERFAIRIANKDEKEVFVQVLVDGLNTLSRDPEVIAPIASLKTAAMWIISANKTTRLSGFYSPSKEKSQTPEGKPLWDVRPLLCVDSDQATAARQNFTEQLGLITVAVYPAIPKTRDVLVDLSELTHDRLGNYDGNMIPSENPPVIYTIHYIPQKTYDTLTY